MKTFDTPEPISVSLDLGVGDVRIEAGDGAQTVVEIRPSNPAKQADVTAAQQTRVEYVNGHLTIEAPSGWRKWTSRRESIKVEISLPEQSRVSAEGGVVTLHSRGQLGDFSCKFGAGSLQLDEVGSVDLRTGIGDITVESAAGRAEIVTGSGAVRVGSIDGAVTVKNSNGATWLGVVTGEARVKAANGPISIDRAHEGVVAKTANGSVHIGEVARGTAVAQSAFGDLEIGIREGVAAWLKLNTKFGDVKNDLDASDGPAEGQDTVEVHATTSFGNIAIYRPSSTRVGGSVEV